MRNKRGFTLVEFLIASLIILFTAAGTFLLLGSATQFSGHQAHRDEAFGYVTQTFDTLKNYVAQDTGAAQYQLDGDTQDCGAALAGYALIDPDGLTSGPGSWTHCHPLPASEMRDRLGAVRTYTVEDLDLDSDGRFDLKRVKVTVNWTEPR